MKANSLSASDIQKLEVFKKFNKMDKVMALKSFNVKLINQGLIVFRSSKTIDARVIGRNRKVLLELIENEKLT